MEPPWEDPQPGSPDAAEGVPSPPCCLDALSCQMLTWHQQPRVTEVSPGCWDVALRLCLGMEELQHHGSAQWDSVVVFSRGGRSEVGREEERSMSSLAQAVTSRRHQFCPSSSFQSKQGRGSQLQPGAQHSTHTSTVAPISPAGQPSTETPAGLPVRAGKTGSRCSQTVTWVRQGGGRARELRCAAVRAAAGLVGQ